MQPPTPPKWSARLKHPDLSIFHNTLKRTQQTNAAWAACCLGNTVMLDTTNRIYKWSIRVISKKFSMLAGICRIRALSHEQFQQQGWSQFGHGNYCVGPGGLVYSHSGIDIDRRQQSFQYDEGDVLRFQYGGGRLKVAMGDTERYQMEVERGKGEEYAICVYLDDEGDAVQLIYQ